MNRIFEDYKRVAQDYDRSFREFEEHVDCEMNRALEKQRKIQRKNHQIRHKVLDKFKRLGL